MLKRIALRDFVMRGQRLTRRLEAFRKEVTKPLVLRRGHIVRRPLHQGFQSRE